MRFRRKHFAAIIPELKRCGGETGNNAIAPDHLPFETLPEFEFAVPQYRRNEGWLLDAHDGKDPIAFPSICFVPSVALLRIVYFLVKGESLGRAGGVDVGKPQTFLPP